MPTILDKIQVFTINWPDGAKSRFNRDNFFEIIFAIRECDLRVETDFDGFRVFNVLKNPNTDPNYIKIAVFGPSKTILFPFENPCTKCRVKIFRNALPKRSLSLANRIPTPLGRRGLQFTEN